MKEERRQFWKNAKLMFLYIFLANSVVLTVSFYLFFHSIDLDIKQIPYPASVTFGNAIFLSLIFLTVYLIHDHFTVTIPVRKIREALEQITNGDFTVRLKPMGSNTAFDPIIESINRMTQELSTVETLKTDFISNVSHEIKTPISVIHNYASLMQYDTLTEEQRTEYARTISDAAVRLDGLIGNILKLNRLENQQIKLGTERFDLGAHLTECLLNFENVWEERNIEIEPEIDEEVFVAGDKELLSIVWNNLLSNAFKFTEPGGTVGVTLTCEGEEAVVTVRDTGCGMSPEEARHIFDKFYQGDTSHSTQGNGLGLALVKRIIDISEGSIAVESVPGEGSTFIVRLKRLLK